MKKNTLTSKEVNRYFRILMLFTLLFCFGNSFGQYLNSPMDHAQSLGKRNIDMAVGYHQYLYGGSGGFNGKFTDNISIRLGLGLGDNVDIQLRYERINPSNGINFLSITPKFSFAQDHLAFFIPAGIQFANGNSIGFFNPTFMYTRRTSQTFE